MELFNNNGITIAQIDTIPASDINRKAWELSTETEIAQALLAHLNNFNVRLEHDQSGVPEDKYLELYLQKNPMFLRVLHYAHEIQKATSE